MTEYRCAGVTFRREVFASYPDRDRASRLTADPPGKLDCVVRLSSPHKNSAVTVAGDTLVLRGEVETNGIRFESRAVLEARAAT